MTIRFVKIEDAAEMLAIYAPFIENTATSFETSVPSISEFRNRIASYTQKYPWLVLEIDGKLAGYAYASKHRERHAYQWATEVSVYVHPQFYRRGVAQASYEKLFYILKEMQFSNVYAIIVLPNAGSVALHTALGFEPVGVYKKIGFKHGAWHDVFWMVKYINDHISAPPAPKSMESVQHLLVPDNCT